MPRGFSSVREARGGERTGPPAPPFVKAGAWAGRRDAPRRARRATSHRRPPAPPPPPPAGAATASPPGGPRREDPKGAGVAAS
eukprot:gene3380-biopygen11249